MYNSLEQFYTEILYFWSIETVKNNFKQKSINIFFIRFVTIKTWYGMDLFKTSTHFNNEDPVD